MASRSTLGQRRYRAVGFYASNESLSAKAVAMRWGNAGIIRLSQFSD
jgi:hypothetical protein